MPRLLVRSKSAPPNPAPLASTESAPVSSSLSRALLDHPGWGTAWDDTHWQYRNWPCRAHGRAGRDMMWMDVFTPALSSVAAVDEVEAAREVGGRGLLACRAGFSIRPAAVGIVCLDYQCVECVIGRTMRVCGSKQCWLRVEGRRVVVSCFVTCCIAVLPQVSLSAPPLCWLSPRVRLR